MSKDPDVRSAENPIHKYPTTGQQLQRRCDCGRAKGPSGQCVECARKSPSIQTKLKISRPGDRYEQEADQMTEKVVRMPAADRSGELNYPNQSQFQRWPGPTDAEQTGTNINSVSPGLESAMGHHPGDLDAGRPLPSSERAFFEPRFGHDFSRVRIHPDGEAAYSAQEISARAYTFGDHIVFGPGQYTPATPRGRRLLAHELAHVVQQQGATPTHHSGIIQRQLESGEATTEEKSLGDRLRSAILEAAVRWEQTQDKIMSRRQLWEIRTGKRVGKLFGLFEVELEAGVPVKNYTTCIQFAQRWFAEAVQKIGNVSPEETLKMAGLLKNLQSMINKELELKFQQEDLKRRIDLLKDPYFSAQTRLTSLDMEMWDLVLKIKELDQHLEDFKQQQEKMEGEGAGQEKIDLKQQRKIEQELKRTEDELKRAEFRHGQLLRALDDVEKKMAAREQELKDTDSQLAIQQERNAAWIRPNNPGVFGNRPAEGDFILLGQPTTGAFGVQQASQVTLKAGAFRHINVLQKIEVINTDKTDKTDKTDTTDATDTIECWHTIDGGDVSAKTRKNYIRLSDHLVFRDKPPEVYPDQPWKNTQPSYGLLGWIDVKKLVETPPSEPASAAAGVAAPEQEPEGYE